MDVTQKRKGKMEDANFVVDGNPTQQYHHNSLVHTLLPTLLTTMYKQITLTRDGRSMNQNWKNKEKA